MAKIALIRTPIIQPLHHVTSLRAVPSIGIAYINAALTNAGHEVLVVDAPGEALFKYRKIEGTLNAVNGLSAAEICQRIPADVEFIGVSVMHGNEWIYDKYIIQNLNQKFPHAKVFIGGENATGSMESILSDPEVLIDLVVLGEGEDIVCNAVMVLQKLKQPHEVNGIAYKDENDRIVKNKRQNNIRNPDAITFPRWEGIPLENYFKAKTGISSHSERSMTMVATRGCPHACTFCTVPNMWNSKWFPRTPENVIEEIAYNIKHYNITHIDFVDLTFATNKNWTERFCELMKEKNFGIRWSLPIGTRTENLTPELLLKMQEAGCLRILFSPESGSKITLRRINKKLKIDDMNRAISGSIDAGIVVKLATIFGFPGQTKKEVLQTLWYIFLSAIKGVHDVVCLCFVPYPGTQLYYQLVDSGELVPSRVHQRLNNDLKDMTSWSDHLPKWIVKYICILGMGIFYSTQFIVRPNRILRAFMNIFIHRQPVTNFESLVYCVLFRPTIAVNEVEHLDSITRSKTKRSTQSTSLEKSS